MDLLGLVKTLRKLHAFLAGLLPQTGLGRRLGRLGRRLADWPPLARLGAWLVETRPYAAGRGLVSCFVWRDHSGDRVRFADLPLEIVPPLRAVLWFVALAVLAILYGRSCAWPALDVHGIEGFEVVRLTALAHYLVLGGIALGWSTLLAGAARTNAWAFATAAAVFLYLVVPLVSAAPPLWRLALVLPAGLVLWLLRHASEAVLGGAGRRTLLALLGGAALALVLVRGLRPLGAPATWLAVGLLTAWLTASLVTLARRERHAPLAALLELAALLALAATGRLVLLVLGHALWPALPASPVADLVLEVLILAFALHLVHQRPVTRPATLARVTLVGFLALLGFLAPLQLPLGQRGLLEAMRLHLAAFDGYLWVVWYFIGVGIIFKLLRETRAVSAALEVLLPGRWLAGAGLGLLGGLLLLGFAEELLLALAGLFPTWAALTSIYRGWLGLMRAPDWFETLLVARWIGLLALGALVYLWRRRQLDRTRGMALAFVALLALVLVREYFFELFSFGRPAAPVRVLTPFLFGIWILWLCYSVGMRAASGDSPRFSRAGRAGLYGGAMALLAALLHLSSVAFPSQLANRTFMQMFLGLMHVGLPYALYVYLGRRFRGGREVSAASLLGAFVLGIVAQLPLLLLGKLALGGYSLDGFSRVVTLVQSALHESGKPPALDPPDGAGFIALSVALGLTLRLAAVAALRGRPLAAVAVFTGYGAAALMPLSLPLLPPRALAAIFPLDPPLTLTLELATHHALHLGLALLVALALRRARGLLLGGLLAGALELGVRLALARWGDYLQSTGLGWSVLVVLGGGALLLLWRLQRDLAPELGDDAPALVPPRHVLVLAGLVAALALGLSIRAAHQARLLPARVARTTFGVPATWTRGAPGPLQSWTHAHPCGTALLLVAAEPVPPGVSLDRLLELGDRRFAASVHDLRVDEQGWHGPLLRRALSFATTEGKRRTGEQVVLRRAGELLSWTLIAKPGACFEVHRSDFRRVAASIAP